MKNIATMRNNILRLIEDSCIKDNIWNKEIIARTAYAENCLPRYWKEIDHCLLRKEYLGRQFIKSGDMRDDFDCTHWTIGMKFWCLHHSIENCLYSKAQIKLPMKIDSSFARIHADKYSVVGLWLWLIIGVIDLLEKEIVLVLYQFNNNYKWGLDISSKLLKKRKASKRLCLNIDASSILNHWMDKKDSIVLLKNIDRILCRNKDWIDELNVYRNLFTHNALHFFYNNRLVRVKKTIMNNREYKNILDKIKQMVIRKEGAKIFRYYVHREEIGDFLLDRNKRLKKLCEAIYKDILLYWADSLSGQKILASHVIE